MVLLNLADILVKTKYNTFGELALTDNIFQDFSLKVLLLYGVVNYRYFVLNDVMEKLQLY